MPRSGKRLLRSFFRRDAVTVARELLGQRLVRVLDGQRLAGLIVETEAYLGVKDRAAHSFGGRRTARTETMYGDGGTAYVYLNYGLHHLFNIVVETVEVSAAVLIRAVEPVEGAGLMQVLRPAARSVADLCSGPGKLGAAFAIDLSHDRLDLVNSAELFLERSAPPSVSCIRRSPRIGVDYAGEWAEKPLRFFVAGSPHVSRARGRRTV
jgi:DNA-3-methyladenine glycosylase